MIYLPSVSHCAFSENVVVLHTIGPDVSGKVAVAVEDEAALESCYKTCLELVGKNGLKSVAFCGISTAIFGFPREFAAKIALKTSMI